MSFYNNDNDENRNGQLYYSPLQEKLRKEEEEELRKRAKKAGGGSKIGYFFTGLSGVIVGALLMWFLVPSLVDQLPTTNSTTGNTSDSKITQTTTEVSSDVTKAVEKVSDAVVGISNMQDVSSNFWFQGGSQSGEQAAGSGSGVIYKIEKGKAYIVTNHHVVEDANRLEVTLSDGSKEEAKLVGSDIWTDLAVITINSDKVKTVAKFGNSDVLKQGETVIAIGNPLGLDFYGSVTKGIISGKDRSVPVDLDGDNYADWQTEVLQTDAAINPGNSGGALVNIAGELVGINSMKIAETEAEGLGFSIPINTAIPVIEELEQKGKVERPQMGISLTDLTEVPSFYQQQFNLPKEVTTGVVVTDVQPGSAADKAGVKKYDVIVEMDGNKIEDSIDLRKYLYNEKEIGDNLKIKVYRDGKIKQLELQLTLKNTL